METSLSVLKKRYKEAVDQNKKSFFLKIKGEKAELLVDYAKYLIQYLEEEFSKRKMRETEKFSLVASE